MSNVFLTDNVEEMATNIAIQKMDVSEKMDKVCNF